MDNISNFVSMIIDKINEILKMAHIDQIDFAALTSTLVAGFFIVTSIMFILWLLKAIGLYTMAKKNNDDYAFLAFIPYFNLYTKGGIVNNTTIFGIELKHAGLLLPLLLIATMLPFTKSIAMLLFFIFYFAILYRIYQSKVPNFAIILLIVSIIIPIAEPFILFFIRNK